MKIELLSIAHASIFGKISSKFFNQGDSTKMEHFVKNKHNFA
ncbi:MAG: hypothetical protein ABII85_04445 [Bacillota bacterium]